MAFIGVRDECLDIFKVPVPLQTSRNLDLFSIALLTALMVTASFFHDLGLINAVGGGALATFLCFVFPALMFRQAIKQSSASSTKNKEREVWPTVILMVVGVVLGVVGIWQSICDSL